MKNDEEISCTVEFTQGAVDRITAAFIDIYDGIRNGLYKGPLLEEERGEES